MSLSTNITNAMTRIATECKALRTLINNNAADLTALDTTATSNLVAAINEVFALATAGGSSATTTSAGVVELATDAETLTGTDTQRAVTPSNLQAKIDALIASAPGALNTLDELAEALGDDANFAATVTTALAGKQTSHANLTALAGLSLIADRLIYANGTGTLALTTFTAAARALLDDADAAAMCVTLDVGVTTTNFVTTFEAGLV